MQHGLQELVRVHQKFGIAAASRYVIGRVGGTLAGMQVVEVVWLEPECLKMSLEFDPQYQFRFLTAQEVETFSADPSNDLDPPMADRAAAGRDLCFAALAGDRLAGYGWYALENIEAEHNFGVALSFPKQVAYMYKGFTHPDFRGARLHGVGMGLALQNLADYGVTRLVSTVDWLNEASLHSCDRLGYQRLGRLITVGREAFHLVYVPRAAEVRGVRFGSTANQRQPHLTAVFQKAEPVVTASVRV